jgi:hypothetical protein
MSMHRMDVGNKWFLMKPAATGALIKWSEKCWMNQKDRLKDSYPMLEYWVVLK